MPHKGYDEGNFTNYSRPPCAQETQSSQQYMPYTMPLGPNNYNSQGQSMYDMMYGHQNLHRSQLSYSQNSPNVYPENIDSNWITEPRHLNDVEKGLKLSDKMETVEISNKELSPASFCSNLDLLLPDFYKNITKEIHYNKMQETQWFHNPNYNHKYSEYPSCAQFGCDDNNVIDKTVKYCSIQKQNGLDKSNSNINNCSYDSNLINSQTVQFSKNVNNKLYGQECQSDYMIYNNQVDKVHDTNVINGLDLQHDEYYVQSQLLCSDTLHFPPIQNIDQHTEASNEESDIIVEESEDEVTDYSEDLEKRVCYPTSCIVCNVLYTPVGSQFYILTDTSPLTMSTRTPVYVKLTEIVDVCNSKCNCICNHCLGLINTIDHLQYKLDSCKCELFNKFNIKSNNVNTGSHGVKRDCVKLNKKQKSKLCNHSFNCKICRKIFSLRKYYQLHMLRHKNRYRYLCDICGKGFISFAKFSFHLKMHTRILSFHKKAVKIDAYLCKICKKPFRTKSNLKEHENYCSGDVPYICKFAICDKKFATSTKLKHHVKLKHDKKFASICSICNIGFIKLSDYKTHMVSHSTDKKFPCSKCDKSYKTLSNLNFHMKFHSEKLPFICRLCSKGFMRKEYLESHINLHNGIKSFICQLCDKKFVSQKNLDAHLKYHDGSVKKKSCNICGKLISTGLEDHIRTHNNLKEFNCDYCDMRFNTTNALTKHKKRKHTL